MGAAIAVAIRCQHGAFFSRALELLAHRKVESVKSAGSSEFLLGTLPTEPILNAQLASLVGKGAGRRGEHAARPAHLFGGRGRTRVKETRWISCAGSPRRVLSMLGSLERWGGVVLPVVPSHPPEILAGARYSTYCDLN